MEEVRFWTEQYLLLALLALKTLFESLLWNSYLSYFTAAKCGQSFQILQSGAGRALAAPETKRT